MPTLLGRAICCCSAEKLRFRLRMPDLLMGCSNLQSECRKQNPALLGRDVRLNSRRVGASARPQPWLAPKPLDAWFFEAQALGGACPRPVGLVASRRLNRRLKRGGLSFGSAGWARSAARGCRAAVRRRFTRLDRATRHSSGHEKVGLHSHRRHGRTCMPMPRGDDKTSQGSCQNTDRTSRMFGSEHQKSTATLTSDFSSTTNPIKMIQKPMCRKLSIVSYEPSSLMNIFKS